MAKKIYNNTELALFLEKNNLKNSTTAGNEQVQHLTKKLPKPSRLGNQLNYS